MKYIKVVIRSLCSTCNQSDWQGLSQVHKYQGLRIMRPLWLFQIQEEHPETSWNCYCLYLWFHYFGIWWIVYSEGYDSHNTGNIPRHIYCLNSNENMFQLMWHHILWVSIFLICHIWLSGWPSHFYCRYHKGILSKKGFFPIS